MVAQKVAKLRRRGLPVRQPTTSFYDVRVAGDVEVADATRELESAQSFAMLRMSKDADVAQKATEALEAARSRMAACFERVTFREVSPVVLDELITAYPYPEKDGEGDLPPGWQWPYIHHLAAASAVDRDATPDEWAQWTADWSTANWNEFLTAVLSAQRRTATEGLPKG